MQPGQINTNNNRPGKAVAVNRRSIADNLEKMKVTQVILKLRNVYASQRNGVRVIN